MMIQEIECIFFPIYETSLDSNVSAEEIFSSNGRNI